MELRPILRAILDDYALPLNGDHGVSHWARVLENGVRLAEETGADVDVVRLFAILHDSRRVNEIGDPEHGPRAAMASVKDVKWPQPTICDGPTQKSRRFLVKLDIDFG